MFSITEFDWLDLIELIWSTQFNQLDLDELIWETMFLWLDLITLLIWFPLNDWQDLIKLAWTIKWYFFLVWSIWYYRLHLSTWFNHLYKSFWWVKLIWSVELNSINWIQIKLICCIGSVIRLDNLNLFRLNLFGPLAWINSIESTQSFQGDLRVERWDSYIPFTQPPTQSIKYDNYLLGEPENAWTLKCTRRL